jgi:hypothetical protein
MAIKTPSQLPLAATLAIDDTVVFVIDDADQETRKLTLAQLRDALGSLALTGDVTGAGDPFGSIALTLADGTVTLARFAPIATGRLLGRTTAGPGIPEELTVGPGLSLTGGVLDTAAAQNAADSATLLDHRTFGGL